MFCDIFCVSWYHIVHNKNVGGLKAPQPKNPPTPITNRYQKEPQNYGSFILCEYCLSVNSIF